MERMKMKSLKTKLWLNVLCLLVGQGLSAQSITESGSAFKFTSNKNRKVIEVDGTLVTGGTKVQIWDEYRSNGLVDGLNQFWHLIPVYISNSTTVYYIMNRSFQKVLDANGPIVDSKKTVIVSDLAAASTAQLWKIQLIPNEGFALVNYQEPDKALSVHPTSNDNGATLFLTTIINGNFSLEQKFFSPQKSNFLTDLDAAYIISPKPNLNRCLGIAGNSRDVNATAVFWDKVNGASNQYYKFSQKPNAFGSNWLQFQPVHSQKPMGALPTSNEQNHFLVQSGNNNSPTTCWTVVAVAREADTYFIFNANGKALSISNTNNGTQIELKSFQNNDNFKFKFQKILVPLRLTWHQGREDNFNFASEDAWLDAGRARYQAVRTECYVYLTQQPNTIPMKLYYSDARGDNFLLAAPASEQAAQAAGYRFVRIEGYVFASKPNEETVTLDNYYHGGRGDNILVTRPETLQSVMQNLPPNNAPYQKITTEGYGFPFPGN
jgi:uncharacterized protein YbcV (DUF1398 family)